MTHNPADYVQPRFTSIRVSIIDFLGMFLPGLAWTGLLLVCLTELGMLGGEPDGRSALAQAAQIVGSPHTGAYYVALLFLALVIGYSMAAVSSTPAEWIVFGGPLALGVTARWLRRRRLPRLLRHALRRSTRKRARGFLFPFYRHHSRKPYYPVVVGLVRQVSGVAVADLPTRNEPFSSCKRLLRLRVPELWEEAEYNEALVRMFNSLFLFSVVYLVMVIGSSLDNVVLALVAVAILGWGLRKKRRREVAYVYLNILLSQGLLRKSLGANNDKDCR